MPSKYYGVKKAKRDQSIRDYAKDHPEATQQDIARYFGINQGTVSRALKPKKSP